MDYYVCFDNLIPEIYSLLPIYSYCCLLRVDVAFRMSKQHSLLLSRVAL